jgi:hypothetical protein
MLGKRTGDEQQLNGTETKCGIDFDRTAIEIPNTPIIVTLKMDED